MDKIGGKFERGIVCRTCMIRVIVLGQCLQVLKQIRSVISKWAGENPAQALAATIIITGCLLPFISALALMSLVAMVNAGTYIQTTGNNPHITMSNFVFFNQFCRFTDNNYHPLWPG